MFSRHAGEIGLPLTSSGYHRAGVDWDAAQTQVCAGNSEGRR